MKNTAVWQNNAKKYPRLSGDVRCDIAVVGGGIAGYLAAYYLSESGYNVTLIEADRLFSGATGRTTAKITANQGKVYAELTDRYGKEVAKLYYKSQTEAMRGYAELVNKYGIDCDFKVVDSYIFSHGGARMLNRTCKILKEAGADCEMTDSAPPFGAVCALKTGGQYLFDPLKFLSALPVGFGIFENTRAVDVDAGNRLIITDNGNVRAEKIVIATHFPVINSHGAYYLKLRQSTSYTLAFGESVADAMYLDEQEDGLSLRPYAEGTILGGCDHRTGRMDDSGRYERLKDAAAKISGLGKPTHFWSAEDVMTFDGMPMAGRYADNLSDIFVITGFNKWGMTNALICAKVICDLICGNKNPYAEIFSPQRHVKKNLGAFLSNVVTNSKEIFLGYFRITSKTARDIPVGCGKIVKFNGKKRAVYRDENDNLYVIGSMCPHMHGELKWNADTKSWDCPCHGSRFDIRGKTLSGPSTKCCKFDEGKI